MGFRSNYSGNFAVWRWCGFLGYRANSYIR
jgi:hypothetical protein